MPEATLRAVLDHSDVRPRVVENFELAQRELAALADAGVDLDAVTAKLLKDGLASFEKDFAKLLDRIEDALAGARVGQPGEGSNLGGALPPPVEGSHQTARGREGARPHLGTRPYGLEARPDGDQRTGSAG